MISSFSISARSVRGHAFASLAALIFLGPLAQLKAADIDARSASLADVVAAITLAKDGDTVNVPAGTATWAASLTITKNITIAGAGPSSTIIINGITGGSSRPPLVSISLARDLRFRMTGFTFRGGVATAKDTNGEIRITGISHSFRIDHCTFDGLYGTSLSVSGFLWGVVDHCLFNCLTGRTSGLVEVKHRDWNGKDWGHGSWADDPYWGTEKFVFIEDNTFEFNGASMMIDSFEGARFVVRHNYMHNCGLVMHGTEGQGRGAKQVEEYNNTYVFDQAGPAGQIRSGCIISHDNTWTNVAKGHILQVYRYYNDQDTKWGIANGQNVYDLNDPNGTVGYWAAGTHTGPNGAATLTDATKNWNTNQWYTPGVAYIIRNKTKEDAGIPAQQSWILSNTSNTVTFSHVTFPGKTPLAFNTGDRYEIWKIERLLDQTGVGKGDLLTGAGTYGTSTMATPKAWPNQITETCYSWNNKDKNGKLLNLEAGQPSVKEGRDFINNTPKPGYIPFTYPHPLVTNLQPPANLQIVGN
jgi:hypothetical protein